MDMPLERKAIILWYNCLNLDSITSLKDLKDGKLFLMVIQLIINESDSSKCSIAEGDSIQERYNAIEKNVNRIFNSISCHNIKFDECKSGSVVELVKLSVLLLSALVKLRLQKNSDLSSMYCLDTCIQEEIKRLMSTVFCANESGDGWCLLSCGNSCGDENTNSSQNCCLSILETPKQSSKAPGRASFILDQFIGTPPSSKPHHANSVSSPLKRFFDSPQMQHQLAFERFQKKIADLHSSLNAERARADDLDQDVYELQEKLKDKIVELQQAKSKINKLRQYQAFADELSAYKECMETQLQKLDKAKEECDNCKMLQFRNSAIQEEMAKFDECFAEKEQQCLKLNEELLKLQESNEELTTDLIATINKCKENEISILEKSHCLLTKEEYISLLESKCSNLEKELKLSRQVSHQMAVTSETMDVVTNTIRVEDLEKALKDKDEKTLELEKIKSDHCHLSAELECSRSQNYELQNTAKILSAQVSVLNSQLNSLSESKEHEEREYSTSVERRDCTINDLHEEIRLLESKCVLDTIINNTELEVLHNKNEKMEFKLALEEEKIKKLAAKCEWKRNQENKLLVLEIENRKLKSFSKEKKANKWESEKKEFIVKYAKESAELESRMKETQNLLEKNQMEYTKLRKMYVTSEKEKVNCQAQVAKMCDLLKSYQDKAALGKTEKEALYEELAQSKHCIERTRNELIVTRNSLAPLEYKVKELEQARMIKIKEVQALKACLKSSENVIHRLKETTKSIESEQKEHDLSKRSPFRQIHGSPVMSSTRIERTAVVKHSDFLVPSVKVFPDSGISPKKEYLKPPKSSASHQWSPASTASYHLDKMVGSYMVCEEEEEFFSHNSLSTLLSSPRKPLSTGKRLDELHRRNSLVPRHLKSSYPVELQCQAVTKFDDSELKEGSQIPRKHSASHVTVSKRKGFFNYLTSSSKKSKGKKENVPQEKQHKGRNPFRTTQNPRMD